MTNKKLGAQTYALADPPVIAGYGGVGGRKESEGPLGRYFDAVSEDDTFGEKTWEKAESAMQKQALNIALGRAGKQLTDLDYLLAGDLLNQCIGSGFAARGFGIPFLGLYGACSTMGESLALAALLLDGGYGHWAAACTSSHFCSAERQYRTPLEYGGQRTPTAQWTATASGAVVLTNGKGTGPYVTHVTIGKVIDKGITDANNMGAAMAPADVRLDPYPQTIDMTALHNYIRFSRIQKGQSSWLRSSPSITKRADAAKRQRPQLWRISWHAKANALLSLTLMLRETPHLLMAFPIPINSKRRSYR